MHTFDFMFGVSLGNLLLCHIDNLSKTLQHKSSSAAEGQTVAKMTLHVLQSLHNEDHFKNFYACVLLDQAFPSWCSCSAKITEAPNSFQMGSTDGNFHTSSDHYHQIYYEALDFVVQAVCDRFNQPGNHVYQNLQELIPNACKGEACKDELKAVLAIDKNRPTERKWAPWGFQLIYIFTFLGCIFMQFFFFFAFHCIVFGRINQ